MTCEQMNDRIVELLYGELGDEERSVVEAHAAGCARCRAELEGLRRTRAVVRGALDQEPAPPARVRASVLAAAAAELRAPAAAAARAPVTKAMATPARAERTVEAPRSSSFWDWLRSRWTLPTLATVGALAVFLLSSRIFMDPKRTYERGRAGIVPAETPPAAAPAAAPPLQLARKHAPVADQAFNQAMAVAREEKKKSAKAPASMAADQKVERPRGGDGRARGGLAAGDKRDQAARGDQDRGFEPGFAAPPPPPAPAAAPGGGAFGTGGPAPRQLGGKKKREAPRTPYESRDEQLAEGTASGGAGVGSGTTGGEAAAEAPVAEIERESPAADDLAPRRRPSQASRRAAAEGDEAPMEEDAAPARATVKSRREAAPQAQIQDQPAARPGPSKGGPLMWKEREKAAAAPPAAPPPAAQASVARPSAPPAAAAAAPAGAPARHKSEPRPETLAQRADRLFSEHRWVEAAVAYRDLLRQDPRNAEVARWRQRLAAAEAQQAASTDR